MTLLPDVLPTYKARLSTFRLLECIITSLKTSYDFRITQLPTFVGPKLNTNLDSQRLQLRHPYW